MRLITFYTTDTPYEQEVKKLMMSVRPWDGLQLTVYPVDNPGSWVLNCGQKPRVCLDALLEHDEDLLYVDADALVVGEIDQKMLKSLDHFAFVRRRDATHDAELLSGTLWMPNTQQTHALLRLWIAAQAARKTTWDQKSLDLVVRNYETQELPATYAKIFDANYCKEDPVIVHNQVSRKYRKLIR